MGLTLIRKSDATHPVRNPKVALVLAGGAVSGGAFKVGGLKALKRLPRRPQDHRHGSLRRPLRRRDPRVVAGRGRHARRDDQGARRHEHAARPAAPFDFYNPNVEEFAARPAKFSYDLATYLPSIAADFAKGLPGLPDAVGPAARDFVRRPSYTRFETLTMDLLRHVSPKREIPALTNHFPSGFLRQREPRALAAPQPGAHQDPERLPRLRAQARRAALHHRLRPGHGRARHLRRRRELRAHHLAGCAGVDRAADLLQACAHQRRRLRRRRRAPYGEHRRRDREGRGPDHLLQPVPPVPEPDRRGRTATPPTSRRVATSPTAGSR